MLKEKYEQKKIRRTETLDHIKEYFDIPKEDRNIFLKELLFEDHFGKLLSWSDISFFLNKSEPIKYMKMYMISSRYIHLSKKIGIIQIKKGVSISRTKWIYLIIYFLSGCATLLMLFGANYAFSIKGPALYAPWTIVTLSLATIASVAMNESTAAGMAKKLVEEMNA
jgi:hypothetical protein